MWLRRGGIWSPVTPVINHGRAQTLALLCEVANRNVAWPPNPIFHPRRGRGRGLGSFLLPQGRGLGSPLHANPQLEPSTVGMGGAKSRPLVLTHALILLCLSPILGQDVCAHIGIFLTPQLQRPPLDPHHWSPSPHQNHLSLTIKLTQINSTPVYPMTSKS